MEGEVSTHKFTNAPTDSLVGTGQLRGTATSKGDYVRIVYDALTKPSSSGFGTIVAKVDANGKGMSGFALYRRTNPDTGDCGAGAVSLRR